MNWPCLHGGPPVKGLASWFPQVYKGRKMLSLAGTMQLGANTALAAVSYSAFRFCHLLALAVVVEAEDC